MKISKRFKAMQKAVTPGKTYGVDEALKIIKDNAKTKFVESVDVAIRLGIDAKKSDQGVRGSTLLPHGTGKTVRVAVFCPGRREGGSCESGRRRCRRHGRPRRENAGRRLEFRPHHRHS